MTKEVYIDLDGTTWNTIKGICNYYNHEFDENVNWYDINTWNFDELNRTDIDHLLHYMDTNDWFSYYVEMMPYIDEALRFLNKNGFKINFYSLGSEENLALKNIKLNIRFFMIPFKFIPVDRVVHKDKTHIDVHNGVIIDDRVDNLINNTAGLAICYGRKYLWNKDWSDWVGYEDIHRCYDWIDVIKLLQKYLKNGEFDD